MISPFLSADFLQSFRASVLMHALGTALCLSTGADAFLRMPLASTVWAGAWLLGAVTENARAGRTTWWRTLPRVLAGAALAYLFTLALTANWAYATFLRDTAAESAARTAGISTAPPTAAAWAAVSFVDRALARVLGSDVAAALRSGAVPAAAK